MSIVCSRLLLLFWCFCRHKTHCWFDEMKKIGMAYSLYHTSTFYSDNSWSEKGRKMTASRLLDLMDWMPLSQITAFRISTQIQCNPNTCKQIVKKLVASKKKAPMITKLVLYGPKIYGSLMAELTKNEIGKTLKCLCFHDVTVNQKTKLASSIADLFRSLPFLEELYIPQSLTGNLASTVLAPLASARGGSSTLLRVLDLTTERFVYSGDRLSLFALSKIGESKLYNIFVLFPFRLYQKNRA